MAETRPREIGKSLDVFNPHDPGKGSFVARIPCDLALRWYKYDYVTYQNLVPARDVLLAPRAVFTGVRDYEEGGYCFLGLPEQWYIRQDCLVPFPPMKILAVYLNPNRWLYDVQAEKTESIGGVLPVRWKERYEALLWPTNTSSLR